MSDKVYVIVDGEYSSYHIVGIYSTRSNADAMLEHASGKIEEWDLDTGIDKLHAGRRLTTVAIRRDGSISRVSSADGIDISAHLNVRAYGDIELVLRCWAVDFAHAVHIAGEARRMIIAENLWPSTVQEYEEHPLRGNFDAHLSAVVDRAVAVVDERMP